MRTKNSVRRWGFERGLIWELGFVGNCFWIVFGLFFEQLEFCGVYGVSRNNINILCLSIGYLSYGMELGM